MKRFHFHKSSHICFVSIYSRIPTRITVIHSKSRFRMRIHYPRIRFDDESSDTSKKKEKCSKHFHFVFVRLSLFIHVIDYWRCGSDPDVSIRLERFVSLIRYCFVFFLSFLMNTLQGSPFLYSSYRSISFCSLLFFKCLAILRRVPQAIISNSRRRLYEISSFAKCTHFYRFSWL